LAIGAVLRHAGDKTAGRNAMCNIFMSQDPATYAAETRPMRLHGHATSIRLEAAFWTILGEIAGTEGLSLSRFVTVLYDEILERHGAVPNFASFLRVTCLHYLSHPDEHAAEVAVRHSPARIPAMQ
jgi:predicted DNA-binding ribbon-helix-helix protein